MLAKERIRRGEEPPFPGAVNAWDFKRGLYMRAGELVGLSATGFACTRATVANDVTTGGVILPFAANAPRIVPGRGLGCWEARTQRFILPRAAETQSISLPSTGSYTLTVWGSGSVAISAGTAKISGAGAATNGSPVTVNCTATGTVTCTVTGSPTFVQLGAGAFPTPPIDAPTTATTCDLDNNTIPDAIAAGQDFTIDNISEFVGTVLNQRIFEMSDGTSNNRIFVNRAANGNVSATTTVGGSATSTTTVAKTGARTISVRLTRAGTVYTLYVDGTLVGTVTTASMPTMTTLHLGTSVTTAAALNGYLVSHVRYQRAL